MSLVRCAELPRKFACSYTMIPAEKSDGAIGSSCSLQPREKAATEIATASRHAVRIRAVMMDPFDGDLRRSAPVVRG
jgi:hypothetical protein